MVLYLSRYRDLILIFTESSQWCSVMTYDSNDIEGGEMQSYGLITKVDKEFEFLNRLWIGCFRTTLQRLRGVFKKIRRRHRREHFLLWSLSSLLNSGPPAVEKCCTAFFADLDEQFDYDLGSLRVDRSFSTFHHSLNGCPVK